VTAPLAAQGSVSGRVLDAQSLQPLEGVQVAVEDARSGTLTAEDGSFRLDGLEGDQVTLRFQLIGYRSVTRTVDVGTTGMEVQLSLSAVTLDEIVITGTAGEQRARAIGNAVGRLPADEVVESSTSSDVQDLIGARVSGVRIRAASGEIGSGGSTTIRGVGSLTLGSEPLIYVDGVRIDNEAVGGGAAFTGAFGDSGPSRINDLNPDDIESIEVIKGPAAATLYGTEASAGVIQIITKKGQADGGSEVRLRVSQGANYLPSPSEVFPTVWGRDPASGELISINLVENDIAEGFGSPFSTGHNQLYAASVSGGADEIRYYMSGQFKRDEGIVPYNWQNQLNGRTNFSFSPDPTIQADLSFGFHTSKVSSASAAQPLTTHMIWGTPLLKDTPTRGYLAYTPEEFEEEVEGIEDSDRSTLSLNLEHTPLDWLRHNLTVGLDLSNIRSTRLCRPDPTNGTPCFFGGVGVREVTRERSNVLSLDYGASASVDVTPDLVASTSVGAQFHREMFQQELAAGQGLAIEELETVSATSADQRSAAESFLENRTLGVYVQEQLAWKNRLFLTAALRGDDNSAFGEEFDFVTYPKLSGSWVMSEEPFFELGPVSTLRLRAAWGEAGQQPDAFAAIRTYTPITGPGGATGLTPENVGNPELEPEVGRELEAGFDAGLLDERLSLDFTYYDKTTENAIVEVPVVPSRGFPGDRFVNIGQVANWGFETSVGAEVLRRDEVGLRFDLSVSRNENEIEELGDRESLPFFAAIGQHHVEGFPLGAIFQPNIVDAEFDSEGNLTNVMCEGGDTRAGGGAPVPCAEARDVFVGQPTPVWVGGLSTTITLFDDLQLYALGEWESGHTRISGDVSAAHLFFRNSRCIHTDCDPFLAAAEQLVGRGQGSLFTLAGLMDGGWAKLRTLSATYDLPASLTRSFGASRASVTLAARNLITLWVAQDEKFGHELPDPETSQAQPLSAFIQEAWPHFTTVEAAVRVTF
jgi:TonB-dependent SusC/RagA subfamily outer membrane receptor